MWLILLLAQERAEGFEAPQELDVLYEGWERVRSSDHPGYNEIRLVREAARSGERGLLFRSLGRGTSFRMTRRAAWPVDPARSHHVTAWVRMSGARRNTASVSLEWLDGSFERLQEDRSEPAGPADGWTEVAVEVPQVPAATRWLAVRLDFGGPDLKGECAFDDLKLESMPRLLLHRPMPDPEGGPAAVRLAVTAARPTEIVVRDFEGREVAPPVRAAEMTTPVLPPGAYRVEVSQFEPAFRRVWPLVIPDLLTSAPALRRPFGGPPALARLAGFPTEDPGAPVVASVPRDTFLRRLVEAGTATLPMEALADREGYPLPELLAVRVANDALAGATPRKDLSLADPDLRDAVFERAGRLVVAVWSERGPVEREIRLGSEVDLRPPFGAARRLAPGDRVRFGPVPVFLAGVEPFLLKVQQSLRFHGALPVRLDPAPLALGFRNPLADEALLDVRIRLLGPFPAGWTVRPTEGTADALGPEQELTREILFTLPAAQEEEEVPMPVELSFTRRGAPFVTRLTPTLRVVPQIAIEAQVAGQAAVRKVTVRISNASSRPLNLAVRIRLPGNPEASVALGLVPAGAAGRTLEYEVRDAHLLDPTAAGECLVEEVGGERLRARKSIPLSKASGNRQ